MLKNGISISVARRLTGLLGVTSAIALVFGVISLAQRSRDGTKPSSGYVCRATGFTPSIVNVILIGDQFSLSTLEA